MAVDAINDNIGLVDDIPTDAAAAPRANLHDDCAQVLRSNISTIITSGPWRQGFPGWLPMISLSISPTA